LHRRRDEILHPRFVIYTPGQVEHRRYNPGLQHVLRGRNPWSIGVSKVLTMPLDYRRR
jgi:hypothetical protein